MDYLRDPAAIYRESFAAIGREARLEHLPPSGRDIAIRMIHACGMVDLAEDIVMHPDLASAGRDARAAGASILCDSRMVRAGIIERLLPAGTQILVMLDPDESAALAVGLKTTRSAAALDLWRDRLGGAVVVIGNAPTALFRLLELLAAGAPRPAAIIATPVGFVGAAESKEALITDSFGVPFCTVRGRRGGSAIASAALNALAAGLAK